MGVRSSRDELLRGKQLAQYSMPSVRFSDRAATDLQTVEMPRVPGPESLDESSFTRRFDRCFVPEEVVDGAVRTGAGRVCAWIKVNDYDLVNSVPSDAELMHQCWLAYTSDDLATDTVRATAIEGTGVEREHWKGVSLDHNIWFHRPMRSDVWHLHDFTCHHFTASRGLAVGHVFTQEGEHVATVAQEVLLRDTRRNHRCKLSSCCRKCRCVKQSTSV